MSNRHRIVSVIGLLVLIAVLSACATPTPQIIEKTVEVIVEKTVEVEVEKTVEVEVIKEVEKIIPDPSNACQLPTCPKR